MLRKYEPHKQLNDFVAKVTREITMDRFTASKKLGKWTLKVDFGTFDIMMWSSSGRRTHRIPLHTVNEVRVGEQALNSKDFRTGPSDAQDLALVILHGTHFRLKQLCLIAPTTEDRDAWSTAVWEHSRFLRPDLYTTHMMRDRWIQRQWEELSDGNDTIGLKELKTYASTINYKMSAKELRDYMQLVSFRERCCVCV